MAKTRFLILLFENKNQFFIHVKIKNSRKLLTTCYFLSIWQRGAVLRENISVKVKENFLGDCPSLSSVDFPGDGRALGWLGFVLSF